MKQTLFERLLDYYHITRDEYDYLTRDVSFDDIPPASNFKGMDEAVALVKKHLDNNDKIVIYGDYDADGIAGTSILVKMFSYLNFDANYYIPSRYIDNYGINETRAKQIIEKGYNLVITVDNGIAAIEPIKLLREANIDVLVIDHHERQEILPDANVIIHPILSNYSTIASSGAFTAFMFSSAMLNRYDKYLSTLAAISLISDMMPLRGYNRDLLRIVIKNFEKNEFPSIDYLNEGEEFSDVSIAMSIAPKINAVGRVNKTTNINRLIKYFTSEKDEEILSYRDFIIDANNLRKEKVKIAKENAINNIEMEDNNAIVARMDIEEGIIGLAANSLVFQFEVPVVVFTRDSNNPHHLKGSSRSIEGFSLSDAFQKLSYLMVNHGGHALAAGLTIEEDKYEEFKNKFIKLFKEAKIIKSEKAFVDLNISEISLDSYNIVRSFSPFGEEWEAPYFRLRNIKVSSLMYSKDQNTIITSVSPKGRIVGFNISKEKLSGINFVDFYGHLKINDYHGVRYIEFNVDEFKAVN